MTTSTAGLATVADPGSRAGARRWSQRWAEVLVVMVKQPFDIGSTAIGAPGPIITAHPEVRSCAVAGPSLGGVAASSFVGGHLDTVALMQSR